MADCTIVRGLLVASDPVDPLTFAAVFVVVTLVAIAASTAASRGLTEIDPSAGLRQE